MSKLLELEDQWEVVAEMMAQTGGEITPEIDRLLAAFNLAESDSVDGYVHVIKALRARAAVAREQAAELISRGRSFDRQADFLSQRFSDYMARKGVRELRGQTHHGKWQGNGGVAPVELLGEASRLPPAFRKPIEVEPDKEKIRQALLDVEHPHHKMALAYARLGVRGESLRFY